MNRKLLVGAAIGALVIAGVAGGYLIFGGSKEQRLLQYVPADTVFFAGSVKPVEVRKYLELSQWSAGLLEQTQPDYQKIEEAAKAKGPFAHFLVALYLDYLEQFRKGPDQVLAHYGLADKTESAVYLVGALPVLRLHVRDSTAFLGAIAAAEQKSGLTPKVEKAGNLQLRRYPIKNPEEGKPGADLVVAAGGGAVVITIDSTKLDDQTRALTLGLQKPAKSLAHGKLAELAKTHELDNDSVFYIDFVEISKSLVNPKSTLLGQHLQLMAGDRPSSEEIQTPACQKEIPAFVAHVPRLVGGLKAYKTTDTGADMTVVYDLEIANAALLKSFSDIRGVLPKHLLAKENQPLAWFGWGVDIDKVAAAVTTMVRDFGAQAYQCEPLLKAQKSVTTQNLAGLMMLGMARGVKGISAAFYSLDMAKAKAGSTDGVDGIVTLSATDPLLLWEMTAKFVGPVTVPKNGEPIDVPLPTGGSIKVALKGNHLVAYLGPKGTLAAQQLGGQDLTPNGVFTVGYDYSLLGQLASLKKTNAEQNPEQNAQVEKLFESLAGFKFGVASDFNAMGWRNEVTIHVPKTKPKGTI